MAWGACRLLLLLLLQFTAVGFVSSQGLPSTYVEGACLMM